jgi:mRNA-degrading endonuclease RelE of RelBE toxin-antitoxin system
VPRVVLSRRAVRDIRRIGPGPELRRIREALHRLQQDDAGVDIKPLQGRAPWMRLRIGDYRVLYRPVGEEERADAELLVARIVSRGDLQRAVSSLG